MLLAIGEGNIGSGACYKKASPLLPSTHCGRAHTASTQVNTQKYGLYWKDCQVGHDPRAFDIKYMPCTSIKGQVLADLVAEFAKCPKEMDVEYHNMGEVSVGVVSIQCPMPWELYVNGTANQRGSGVGLVLVSPEKITIEKSLRLSFSATNNESEYEALLMGIMMV